jgi:metallo-beta-lactamase class B
VPAYVADWFEPFPAHKVIGNMYYVGSKDLATFLITTREGHILINSGFERTVPLIEKSVESLGFKMTDVKILLASHAHSDHVAGHALLEEVQQPRTSHPSPPGLGVTLTVTIAASSMPL